MMPTPQRVGLQAKSPTVMLIGFAPRIFRGGPTVWATHDSFSMLGERSCVRKGSFDYPCEEKGPVGASGAVRAIPSSAK